MTDIDKSGNYSRVRANKKLIGALMDTEDAAYIVRAVNAHEELVRELKTLTRLYSDGHMKIVTTVDDPQQGECEPDCALCSAEKAIAKAEGRS